MASYNFPVDPECPVVFGFNHMLACDPMTEYTGVGDEIIAGWERKHLAECERCKEYAAANVEVV